MTPPERPPVVRTPAATPAAGARRQPAWATKVQRVQRESPNDDGWLGAIELVTATFTWGGIGWLVDHFWLHTYPVFMSIGFVVGFFAGMYLLWLKSSRVPEPGEGDSADAEPVSGSNPVELRLARSAVAFLLVLGGPVIAVAALLDGWPGALSAGIGAAVVIGMFLMAGALMSYAARISPAALMGAVLGGYILRLAIYAGLIVLLRPVEWLSGPSLAIATAVLLVAVLVWEVRQVSRTPNLFWVDASAGSTPAAAVVQSRDPQGLAPAFVDSPNPPVERTRP